jgi:Pectate lyase superfamily protein
MSSIDTLRTALFGNPPSASTKPSREGVLAAVIELKAEAPFVDVKDYGAKGDYNTATVTGTDDTQAFVSAIASLGDTGGTILVPRTFKCLIDGSITLPPNVVLVGESSIGEQNPADLLLRGSTIYLNPSASITLSSSSGFRGVNVFRKGLTFNITYAQVISTFAGSAILLANNTSDHILQDMLVLGFLNGVKSQSTTGANYTSRTKFLGFVGMDCINCVKIYNAADIPVLNGIECWPYVTVASAAETNGAQLKRPGTAVELTGLNDWTKLIVPFNYGYYRGFHIADAENCILYSSGSDYPYSSVSDGSIGILIDGAASEITLIAPQTAQHDHGVYVNSTATKLAATIIAGQFWENRNNGVIVDRGDVQIVGGFTRSSFAGSFGTQALTNAGKISVLAHDYRNVSVALVNTATTIKLRHTNCTFNNVTTLATNPYMATVASQDPLPLNGEDTSFTVTGTTNFGTVTNAPVYSGKTIVLRFTGVLTVNDGGASLFLNGSFTTANGSTLTLWSSGSAWYEQSRCTP